jgi:hypothetical protein
METNDMSLSELESHLNGLQGDLEDLGEERTFVLGQTGLHVSAGEVKKYETRIEDLKSRITEVQDLVDAKRAGGA